MSSCISDHRSRWPHFLAVTLACATFPLIWVGGLVTTYDAGMAVPDWPTTYGYNMFLYPLSTWISGPWDLFIEHGHRLLGSLTGLITIGLLFAVWIFDARKWMRWVAVVALLLVIGQGVLGGMRVRMASTDFARLHGCTGPLFFSLVIAICVMTSRFWNDRNAIVNNMSQRMVTVGWFTFGLAFVQLVIGAHLRHPGIEWTPAQFRAVVVMHVITAVFLVFQTISIAIASRKLATSLRNPATLLGLLVSLQFLLGVLTWRAKYGWPTFIPVPATWTGVNYTVAAQSMAQAITVTGHVALGSLILATSIWYAVRLSRSYSVVLTRKSNSGQPSNCATSMPRLEGAMS